MRILFGALHNGYYRNIDSVVETLADRGHEIVLGSERNDSAIGGQTIVEALASRYPRISVGRVALREDETAFLSGKIRFGYDYLRYLDPMYTVASGLRPRAEVRTPQGIVRLSRLGPMQWRGVRRAVAKTLDAMDRAVPLSPAIERYLDEQRPDLVVITPLIGLVQASQLDLLRSAQARGIPTAVIVWSWDHLSSKAVIRDVPDGVFVWNDAQKDEAVTMHGVPPERVVVTGAQCFDRWFGRSPSQTRAEFCRRVGLPDDRPYVMWACSALLPGSPPEPDLVVPWLERIRASSSPVLRDVPILIRPHPSRTAEWDNVDWARFGPIAMFGDNPIEEGARSDYFDSLCYSAAVVGITTSAFIEAAVVGRPVMTIFFDAVRQEHEGSLHFRHLLRVAGGVMNVASTLEEHEHQLEAMVTGPPPDVVERGRRFVEAFVRPHGLDVPATGVVADALERLATVGQVVRPRPVSRVGQLGLRMLTRMEHSRRWRPLLLDAREAEQEDRIAEKARQRDEALARKAAQRAEKARRAARRAPKPGKTEE